jgi:hypothetical protein
MIGSLEIPESLTDEQATALGRTIYQAVYDLMLDLNEQKDRDREAKLQAHYEATVAEGTIDQIDLSPGAINWARPSQQSV